MRKLKNNEARSKFTGSDKKKKKRAGYATFAKWNTKKQSSSVEKLN